MNAASNIIKLRAITILFLLPKHEKDHVIYSELFSSKFCDIWRAQFNTCNSKYCSQFICLNYSQLSKMEHRLQYVGYLCHPVIGLTWMLLLRKMLFRYQNIQFRFNKKSRIEGSVSTSNTRRYQKLLDIFEQVCVYIYLYINIYNIDGFYCKIINFVNHGQISILHWLDFSVNLLLQFVHWHYFNYIDSLVVFACHCLLLTH